MNEILSALRAAETWIYVGLSVLGLYFLRHFARAWQDLQGATFGLERENAQGRLNQSASALVLILTFAVVVFVLVSFVAPAMPDFSLPTPTLNLLATVTTTLPAGGALTSGAPQPGAAGTPVPPEIVGNGCIPGQVELSMPGSGQEVSGIVPVMGTANIPNFGFYKFEIKRPNETVWLTIQAGNQPRTGDKLGDWDTTRLAPGEYQLGLVVVDNQAQAMAPCIIQLRVARAPEPTIAP